MWSELAVVATLAGGIWYALAALRAREIATAVAREYCRRHSLQLLDGTVALSSVTVYCWRPQITLRRCYEFHYSSSDHERLSGVIIMLGPNVENFVLS